MSSGPLHVEKKKINICDKSWSQLGNTFYTSFYDNPVL